MAVINHPSVVQFHGACVCDNLAMIVLEYMEVHDITLSGLHCEVMLITTMLVVMSLSGAVRFHGTCLRDNLALTKLDHMEAHDINLRSVNCDTAHHVITTSTADEAGPRKAQEHLKLLQLWIA